MINGAACGNNIHSQLGSGWDSDNINYLVGTEANEIKSMCAYYTASIALLNDGTLRTWGGGFEGCLCNGSVEGGPGPFVPALKEVKEISAIACHGIALLENGEIRTWGSNTYGQLGNGETAKGNENNNLFKSISVNPGLNNVVKIAAGVNHCLACLSDGTVMAWGNNAAGQIGDGTNIERPSPVLVSGINNAIDVAAGGGHSLVLLSDGTVKSFGNNRYGQLGNEAILNKPDLTNSNIPVDVKHLENVVSISAGAGHSLALTSSGAVWSWGEDSIVYDSNIPIKIPVENCSGISAGREYSLVVSEGKIFGWGRNQFGQLDNNQINNKIIVPTEIKVPGKAIGASAGEQHSLIWYEGELIDPELTFEVGKGSVTLNWKSNETVEGWGIRYESEKEPMKEDKLSGEIRRCTVSGMNSGEEYKIGIHSFGGKWISKHRKVIPL